ncbi:FmdB family transcriptional regulator [Candidatus Sumerlaeota bacterium]|nr:FmdB family transcriptional regulator [Candidatus Sumerlaeota bacterium]
MPTYEYECGACGHLFSAKQRMSDAPLDTCPECGEAVKRLLSGAGVIVKGSSATSCSMGGPAQGACSTCCPQGMCDL